MKYGSKSAHMEYNYLLLVDVMTPVRSVEGSRNGPPEEGGGGEGGHRSGGGRGAPEKKHDRRGEIRRRPEVGPSTR